MGQAAAHALSDTIQSTYRDAFHSTVVPAFERACSSMFQQINTIFDAGTRECKFLGILMSFGKALIYT